MPNIYTAVASDTVDSVAERYSVSPELLAVANGMRDGEQLQPGQMLVIPETPTE